MNNYQALTREIRIYMLQQINYHIDPITGEANCTSMAEDAIDELAGWDTEEWFEEGHPVWDIAVDVAEETGYGVRI